MITFLFYFTDNVFTTVLRVPVNIVSNAVVKRLINLEAVRWQDSRGGRDPPSVSLGSGSLHIFAPLHGHRGSTSERVEGVVVHGFIRC